MGEWLAQYWLDVLFTLLLGALAYGGKKLVHFYIKELKSSMKETEDRIFARIEKREENQEAEMAIIKKGLLSIQRKQFKEKCHELLSPEHEITVEEMENITKDHEAYKSLGGNHEGDTLFELVIQKAKNNIK